jgi:hypothetical protein
MIAVFLSKEAQVNIFNKIVEWPDVKRLLLKLEINSAVFFSLLTKIWGLLAGGVTVFLIVTRFSPDLQGYYYTFSSLLALQVFAELGFGTVIIQYASHEWSKLGFDAQGHIVGDPVALARLTSLARLAFKWYCLAGLLLTFFLGIGGYLFFAHTSNAPIDWKSAWLILSFWTGVSFVLIPMWSLLEGCNQVSSVYRFRFIQSLFGNITIWIAILLGAKLWVPVISSVVIFVVTIVFFVLKYRNFFVSLSSRPPGKLISWHSEILPLQWKIALSWISGYFLAAFFTPVVFKYYGPIEAGRMGLTLNLISIVAFVGSSWTVPRVPSFGVLINRRDFKGLNEIFWKISKMIFFVSFFVSALILIGVYALSTSNHPFSHRLLGPLPIALFLLATIAYDLTMPMGYYLIAHKKMPTLKVAVAAGLVMCIFTLVFGKYYGATGIAAGYLSVMIAAFFWTTAIWKKCRISWHTAS